MGPLPLARSWRYDFGCTSEGKTSKTKTKLLKMHSCRMHSHISFLLFTDFVRFEADQKWPIVKKIIEPKHVARFICKMFVFGLYVGTRVNFSQKLTVRHTATFKLLDVGQFPLWTPCLKSGDEMPSSLALAEASFVKRVAYILIVAPSPVIRMVRWLTAFAPLNTSDVVTVSAPQASKKESLLTIACSSPKEHAFEITITVFNNKHNVQLKTAAQFWKGVSLWDAKTFTSCSFISRGHFDTMTPFWQIWLEMFQGTSFTNDYVKNYNAWYQ